MPSQRQQLLEQMLGALHALLECGNAVPRHLGKVHRVEVFRLQAERGDRRPHFMCCIGNKPPLLIQQQPYSRQQSIDGGDEGMQLARRAGQP